MNRETAIDLLDRLHKAQNEFYAGGSGAALQQLLAPNVMWTVSGHNRIAGTYRGLDEVLDYFRRRRDLANQTFQIKRRDDSWCKRGFRRPSLNPRVSPDTSTRHPRCVWSPSPCPSVGCQSCRAASARQLCAGALANPDGCRLTGGIRSSGFSNVCSGCPAS